MQPELKIHAGGLLIDRSKSRNEDNDKFEIVEVARDCLTLKSATSALISVKSERVLVEKRKFKNQKYQGKVIFFNNTHYVQQVNENMPEELKRKYFGTERMIRLP